MQIFLLFPFIFSFFLHISKFFRTENLSNLDRIMRDIIVSCCKLSDLWRMSDLETKQRIQNLTFPNGIFWDKENKHYRTENRTPIYDVFDGISASYGRKKETGSEEPVSSCLSLNNYRTLIDGFRAVTKFIDWHTMYHEFRR